MAELIIVGEEFTEFMKDHPFFKDKELESVRYYKVSKRFVMKYNKKIPRVEDYDE